MLDKRSRNIVVILGITILVIILSEIFRPRPIDWRPSYTSVDKIPFGAYVLFEEFEALFRPSEIETVTQDPFEFLLQKKYKENSAYFFVDDHLNFDERQFEELRTYAAEGNTVFLSSRSFGYMIQDSLKIESKTNYELKNDTLFPKLFNPQLKTSEDIRFDNRVFHTVFTAIDTLQTTALGYFDSEEKPIDELNFIEVQHGQGRFYLHTLPEAFSNYYLLKNHAAYTENLLSYIQADHIYWDAYLKSGRKVVTSPMRFVFSEISLKWAYYVAIVGVLLLLLFKAKRQQRIIPVIKPLKNTSIEFTQTIGDLYFQHKDYTNIIAKKITYFFEIVRSKYYLNTQQLDDRFITKLSQKSGNTLEDTQQLIQLIAHLKEKAVHSEQDLIALNNQMEEFNA